jgi:hypothetical protein
MERMVNDRVAFARELGVTGHGNDETDVRDSAKEILSRSLLTGVSRNPPLTGEPKRKGGARSMPQQSPLTRKLTQRSVAARATRSTKWSRNIARCEPALCANRRANRPAMAMTMTVTPSTNLCASMSRSIRL